jgi:hypothetical protein
LGSELGKERLEKSGGEIRNLEIIQDWYAIYDGLKN